MTTFSHTSYRASPAKAGAQSRNDNDQASRFATSISVTEPRPLPGKAPLFRSPAQHGFTLIELMISLLIFGLLSAAGVALLAFSVRAQSATGDKLEDVSALARVSAALSADLAQATLRRTRNEAGDTVPAFTGEHGSTATPMLRLVRAGWSNVDDARRASDQKVEYRVVDDTLQRIAYPMLDGADALPPAVLLTKVRQASLRYRLDGAWSDRWQGTPRAPLPQVLELRLTRSDGTEFRQLFLVGSGYRPMKKSADAS